MEYIGNILCVSHKELVDGGILSKANISSLRHRGILMQIRRACPGQEALFSVDSLPEKYKKIVLAMYPRPEGNLLKEFAIIPDRAAWRFYGSYLLPDGRHLPTHVVEELSKNAELLNAFGVIIERSEDINHVCGYKVFTNAAIWKFASNYLKSTNFPNSLPKNVRMLQRKYEEYKREGYIALVSKKYCNNNSAKIKDDLSVNLLTQLVVLTDGLSTQQIASFYNKYAFVNNWKTISAGTVSLWREKMSSLSKFSLISLSIDKNAVNYFKSYILPDGSKLKEEDIIDFSSNAAILNALDLLLQQQKDYGKVIDHDIFPRHIFWKYALEFLRIPSLRHSLPKSKSLLEKKFMAYKANGYGALIKVLLRNLNSVKIATNEQIRYITNLLSFNNNFNDAKVCKIYNEYAKVKKWKIITVATVAIWRKKVEQRLLDTLDQIRTDSVETCESLLTEDDVMDMDISTPINVETVCTPSLPNEIAPVQSIENQILIALLQNTSITEIIKTNHLMPTVLAERINEMYFDEFADNVVDCEGSTITLIDDYVEDLKNLLLS